MLSNEERNRLVKTYKKFPDAVKVAEIYSVSPSSAYRPVRRMKDAGSVDLKAYARGRKPSLSAEDVENIRRTVLEEPDITIRELNAKLNLGVSDETVRTTDCRLRSAYPWPHPFLGGASAPGTAFPERLQKNEAQQYRIMVTVEKPRVNDLRLFAQHIVRNNEAVENHGEYA